MQHRAQLAAAAPEGEGRAFALAAFAVLFVLALVEGGPWAWVIVIAALTAALITPALLRQPWRMLCVLIVPTILTGQLWVFKVGAGTRITPSLVVVSWCLLISSFGLQAQSRVHFWKLPLFVPFSIYWVGVALSVIPSVSKLHWARGMIEVILGYGLFLFGYVYLQNREQLHSLLKIFLGLVVVTVLFGLVQHWLFDYFRGLLPLLYDDVDTSWVERWYTAGRIVANWAHPSNLGSMINLASPIALYYYLESDKPQIKYILIYSLFIVGVLMTSTRTPMVAFAITSVLLIVVLRRRISRLFLPLGVFLLCAAIVIPFIFASLQRFDLSSNQNDVTVEGRAVVRLEAFLLFLQNPVLGVGKYNYQDRVFFSDPNLQGAVHNVFIEEAAETGLVGAIPFFLLLYAAFRGDFRRGLNQPRELRAISWTLFAACVAVLIESLAENSLLVWQVACLFWLFRGVSLALRARPEAFAAPHSLAA